MTGLATRYDLRSPHPIVGTLMGDRPIDSDHTNASLYDLMQNGHGVLLDGSAHGNPSALVASMTNQVHCVQIKEGPSMLLRPDACVAWVSDRDDIHGLGNALQCWFASA
ncbi:hypothetical protein [Dyella sp.]|uniref:aromatic-ring hydroxylase C-terminal domain-containing protein n=1 Tax=Dyella sp. TaxID=1869338 RepID=UPI002ED44B83